MSEEIGFIECNLCSRMFKKYDNIDSQRAIGISLQKLKRNGYKLSFSKWDKSDINRHICTYCISDIINKYS
ncbi:MAG TPA: hypothetical protein PKD00_09025 [Burkholderiales bacterium]|nr:hypothetical protein [Burkholderiales bacterium]